MAGKRRESRQGGKPPASGEQLLRQLEKEGKGRVQISRHSEKLAAALWDVAKPMVGKSKSRVQVEQGLRTAMLAWNLALLPEEKRQETLEQSLQPIRWPFRWFVRRMIKTLLSRKQELYPGEYRMIADVQVSGEAPQWSLKVATVQGAR